LPQQPAANPLGGPFIELPSVDSTNNYALSRVHAGLAQHGTAFFAHEQLAGKGQRGRLWKSDKDANIILSVVLDPGILSIQQQFHLSACSAVAVQQFFSRLAGEETRIKWPNDLYWQDRKAGGILIENIVTANRSDERESQPEDDNPTSLSQASAFGWKWAIVGIGININQDQFSNDLPNPVSLRQITGKKYDPVSLAKDLCAVLHQRLFLLRQQGFDPIYKEYLRHLYKKNQLIRLKKESRSFEARLKSVSPMGKLVVEHGLEESFEWGEVEWVR
jgi:BirA family biotin operon repressor/biotin-[acetyl-CoA-carboxylase] ligase